ncbi:tripartite tricarboxylate transporter substrate binding protein [Uliginosibacterium flavum]|uniref:Tripartite tricarboxylate transporter substrate binding protein n=1 Tax=Uliginosibacterium flavum TaxID=1396831 RepID=A0ABV2TL70_9RHOO
MFRAVGLLIIWGLLQASAQAAEPYPSRPITLVIPYAAGSDTDVIGRMLGSLTHPDMNARAPVFENRTGASGLTASLWVRAAAPDGYTLLIARVGTHAIAPAIEVKRPYDQDEFTTLAILSTNPLICAVRKDSPYKTSRDLLAAIRQQPGKLKYGTSGAGTIQNLAAQYLLALGGLKPEAAKVRYSTSGATATEDLVNGHVDFVCNNANTVLPGMQAGKLRGLFTTAPARMTQAPDLLTAREAGLRDMVQIQGWTALMGPAKLPAEVTSKWKTVLAKLAKDPQWLAGNIQLGAQSALLNVKDPEKFVRDQYVLYDQLITTQGLRQ